MALGLLCLTGPPAGAVQYYYTPPPGSTAPLPAPSPITYYITDVENRIVLVNGHPAVPGVAYSATDYFEVDAAASGPGRFTLVQNNGYSTTAFATALTSGGVTTLGDGFNDLTAIWIDESNGAMPPSWPYVPGQPLSFTAIWIDE
jgi:hypothetical protein